MTLKRIKLLGINLTAEGCELYAEKYKLLMEEVKENTNKWNNSLWTWVERQYYLDISPKTDL